MNDVICVDCEYYYDGTIIDENDDFEYHGYCQRGSVIIEIDDPIEPRNCADFKQFVDDI